MKQKRSSWKVGAILGGALVCMLSAGQIRAEILEQNWQPNQKLSYDLKMTGTMRLTAPPEVPMVGGLPLEILLRGDGQSTLEAREVDDFGTALVIPKIERLNVKFNETTFNQNGSIGFQNGKMNVALNGQSMGLPAMDWSMLSNPTHGLRFTRSLRMTGLQKLGGDQNETQAPQTARKNPLPAELPAILQGMIVQSIPPLLPTQDVNIGDTWNATVRRPVLPGNAAPATQEDALGEFEFTAVSEELIQNRRVWKIAIDGTLKAMDFPTTAASAALNQRSKGNVELPFKMPQFLSMAQKTKGHIWFDLDAGRIVKSDLNLMTQTQARAAGGKDAAGVMYFTGRVQMDLL